jgi:hypothetical protein
VLTPGSSASIGNITLNLGNTTGITAMAANSSFEYQLGVAGLDINAFGTSDLLTIAGASANDFGFSGNNIDLLATGGIGFYKLFDTSSNNSTTWTGLTVTSGTGVITSGLTTSNLLRGLTGTLIMGGNSLGGTSGDIYLHVVAEQGAAVPEPSAALLASLGALFLLHRRRNA